MALLGWQHDLVTSLPQNLVAPAELSPRDVDNALARIAARDPALARRAGDAFEGLTWGEGPGLLRQAGLQEWLWYVVPTKYITDEAGYMGRLAGAAAALFDELGLHRYAAICRSSETEAVHAAFDRRDSDGIAALNKAMQRSGIVPPDLADFEWSPVMGVAEAAARSAVEDALESALTASAVVVGSRGWRAAQAAVAAEALDADHPQWPGQSWRTAVVTERIEWWVDDGQRRSALLGSARAAVANRLLHPIQPPSDLSEAMAPLTWYLARFGAEQALTQAGYLAPAFVESCHSGRPWSDPLPLDRPPRSEVDDFLLHELRVWLQQAGALRKRKDKMLRTAVGAAMADDPVAAWDRLTRRLVPTGWGGFVAETAILVLLELGDDMLFEDLLELVASAAADAGWATTVGPQRRLPEIHDVSWSLHDSMRMWRLCGLADLHGDWSERRLALTDIGTAAMLTGLRHVGAGPRDSP